LFNILSPLNNLNSQEIAIADAIDPYCNGAKAVNFIKENKIHSLEIETNKSRKWNKNLLQTLLDLNSIKEQSSHKDWFDFRIKEKNKEKFKSIVKVKFRNQKKVCYFKAKIRITGDLWWHLGWKNGNPISSIYVELLNGNINSITRFKLLLPKSRYGENEIFIANLFREIGYLAPRTFMVQSKINGFKVDYIFQEDLRKEFLENLNYREGPILEGDERFTIMLTDKKSLTGINLSKIANKKFLLKNESNAKSALSSVSNLNLLYLQNHQIKDEDKADVLHINSEKFFKSKKNKKIHETFESLIYALDAEHHLSYDDRRFYYDSIEQNYLPIYYDGKSKIIYNEQITSLKSLKENTSIPAQRGALNAIELIEKIDHNLFLNKITNYGFLIEKPDYKKLIDKIKSRLKVIATSKPNKIVFPVPDKYFSSLKDEKYKNKKLVFVNYAKKEFKICDFDLMNCKIIQGNNLNFKKLLADVLSQEFLLIDKERNPNLDYIFVYNDINYDKKKYVDSSSWSDKKINKNTSIKYNEDVSAEINTNLKSIKLTQLSNRGRVIIKNGKLNGWSISYFGHVSENANIKIENELNLTGCLTFIDIEIINLNIKAENSECEDAVNLIRVTGNIKNVDIKNSLSDGMDLDYSKVSIDNLNISSALNDCIDFSYGIYQVKNIILENCGDKGVSVGEKSKLAANNVNINFSNIAIAVKDSSFMTINESEIKNTKICFASYRKKQEFAGSVIKIKKTNCNKQKFFVGKGSEISLKNDI